MHEMSIALSIIDIVTDNASKAEAKSVSEVELDIGELSGIELEALIFAFDTAKVGTLLEKCKTIVNRIKPIAKCATCSHEFNVNNVWTSCPVCSDTKLDIIAGQEMRIKSINIE